MKNYKIQNGTIKVSAIWHEPKGDRKRGIYTIGISKSVKDQSGNWKDDTVYLFPEELFTMTEMLKKMQTLFLTATTFEIKKEQGVDVSDIDSAAESVGMSEQIPF